MKAEISDRTLERLSEKIDRPITRGVDKAVNEALDKLEGDDIDIMVCSLTEKMAEDEEV